MKKIIPLILASLILLSACAGNSAVPTSGAQTSNGNGLESPDGSVIETSGQSTDSADLPAETKTPDTVPTGEPKKIASISVHDHNSFAVTVDGELYAAGNNGYGELGTGEAGEDSCVFIKVMDGIKTAVVFQNGSYAINTNDELLFWGSSKYFGDTLIPIKLMDNVKKVCSGTYALLVLTHDGDLYSVGTNEWGELSEGFKDAEYDSLTKIAVGVADVSAHLHSLLYVATGGEVFVTTNDKDNTYYQLKKLADDGKSVSVGYNFSLFINEQDELYGYGRNDHRAFGIGIGASNVYFEPIMLKEGVLKAWADYNYSFIITSDHTLYGAGINQGTFLALEDKEDTYDKNQILYNYTFIMENVLDVYSDNGTSMLITTDGDLYVSGHSASGHLGTGSTESISGFTKVTIR